MSTLYKIRAMLASCSYLSGTDGAVPCLTALLFMLVEYMGRDVMVKAIEASNLVKPVMTDKVIYTTTMPLVTEEMRNIARDEGKISAIKAYRTAFGCGLKEAKDAIESQITYFKSSYTY